MSSRRRPLKGRTLSVSAINTLGRLLTDRGLSGDDIDRGLDYVVENGATTLREGYTLALSRLHYTDEELIAGRRFQFEGEA